VAHPDDEQSLGENRAFEKGIGNAILRTIRLERKPSMIMGLNQIVAWPNFVEGEQYSVVVTADGTLRDHMQCHSLHDAVAFKGVSVRIYAGIISAPDTMVVFYQEDN
jgi:hypothetical protein